MPSAYNCADLFKNMFNYCSLEYGIVILFTMNLKSHCLMHVHCRSITGLMCVHSYIITNLMCGIVIKYLCEFELKYLCNTPIWLERTDQIVIL